MSTLARRVLAAVVLIAALLVVLLFLPAWIAVSVVGLVLLTGAWEWSAFLRLAGTRARAAYVLVVAAVLVLMIWLVRQPEELEPVLWGSLLWWTVAFITVLRYPRPLSAGFAALAGVLVLVPGGVTVAVMLGTLQDGATLLLLALVMVWSADVGAYFLGRRFGRLKLAPRVSPGKTWEGALGGTAAAMIAGIVGGLWLGLPLAGMAALGVAVAGISVVGDLTVSLFKREAGLKDSGHIIPGHGGILDRVDSIAPSVPLFALVLLQWLP